MSGKRVLKSSYYINKEQALERFPMLKKESLKGALIYYDGKLLCFSFFVLLDFSLLLLFMKITDVIFDKRDIETFPVRFSVHFTNLVHHSRFFNLNNRCTSHKTNFSYFMSFSDESATFAPTI